MKAAPALLLLLAACSRGPEDASEAAITNQAESLERAANATTDQLIKEIDAVADREAEQQSAAADNNTDGAAISEK